MAQQRNGSLDWRLGRGYLSADLWSVGAQSSQQDTRTKPWGREDSLPQGRVDVAPGRIRLAPGWSEESSPPLSGRVGIFKFPLFADNC